MWSSLFLLTITYTTPLTALPNPQSQPDLRKRDYWGPAFSSGPTSSNVRVVYAAMTLTPGAAPPDPKGDLFIWPGIGGSSDLLQMVFMAGECGVAGPRHINRPAAVAGPSDRIRIQYGIQADKKTWFQNATNLATGKIITSLTSDSGNTFQGVGTADECNSDCSPTVSTSIYEDWEVHLDAAGPTFQNTFGVSGGAKYESATSEQGGKAWKIKKITLPLMI